MSLFANVSLAPRDPLLGLVELYKADPNPSKVDLSLGVYTDEEGKIPVLKCVAVVQNELLKQQAPKGYLPIDGLPAYDETVRALYFGAESEAVKSRRIVTVQSVAGTGAIKLGSDFLHTLVPDAAVLVSDPTWANHHAIFKGSGFQVGTYPYYDEENKGIRFDDMMQTLQSAKRNTIVVLHACCHNPTGYDLSPAQWDQVLTVMQKNGLIPFMDMAYQGFGDGFEEDGYAIQKLLSMGMQFFMSTSFSKIFSIYGERAGALSVVCDSTDEAERVLSQIKQLVRANYSNPPTFAAQIISTILGSKSLRQQWFEELNIMRHRVQSLRETLVKKLQEAGVQRDMSFIARQKGMFSYTGLNKAQMLRIRSEYGIYGTDAGRICVASLNDKNMDYVARSITKIVNEV